MFPEAVTEAVNAFADFLLRYAIALAAVGAFSMAAIEAWKKIFDSRTKYHLRAVQDWIRDDGAYAQLIHLTTGSKLQDAAAAAGKHFSYSHKKASLPREQELALFTLELERMMGHIQDAADAVLRDPGRYGALYAFLTSGVSAQDAAQWAADAGRQVAKEQANEHASLYSRVQGAARRKIDGFQLFTGFRWANSQQLAANALGTVVLFSALAFLNGNLFWKNLVPILVVSVLGGVLAPIAKDIVVALKRVRTGT